MFIPPILLLVFVLLAIEGLCGHAPAPLTWDDLRQQARDDIDRARATRQHTQHRRLLKARKKAMARVYWQQSRWQWLLYCGRTNPSQGRREVERYMALVEQRWADALATQAPGPVIPPPPLPLSLVGRR